jgi:hypothetical protein
LGSAGVTTSIAIPVLTFVGEQGRDLLIRVRYCSPVYFSCSSLPAHGRSTS